MKTKDLTFVALLLTVGVVLKALTDSFMRTALFFLMWDPLTIINTCIFMKYKDKKYLFAIIVVETVLAATIFTTTDIFFLRPLDVIITYLVCWLIKGDRIRLKYFLSTFLTLFVNIGGMLLILLLMPGTVNVDVADIQRLFSIVGELNIWGKVFAGVIFITITTVWLCIPSVINMFLGKKITDTLNKVSK